MCLYFIPPITLLMTDFLKIKTRKKNLDMSKLKNSSGEFSFTVAYYFNRDTHRF